MALVMALAREGALMRITGVKGKLKAEGSDEESDVNGLAVQLVEEDERSGNWSVMTLDSGMLFEVPRASLESLPLDYVKDLDLVLGPASNEDIVAEEMAGCLTEKGYCISKTVVPHEARTKMWEVTSAVKFSRVPSEFEPYYLGRDSREKSVLIDFDSDWTPKKVAESPFRTLDASMGDMYSALAPHLEERFGIKVTSRTNLMIRQTFEDELDEIEHIAGEPTNSERENFMTLMKRKKVCMIQFVGPKTGTFTLIPKGQDAADEIVIQAAPGVMVTFLTELYHYSHTCEDGATTSVQMWFLSQRPIMQLQGVAGDMQMLGQPVSGRAPPPKEQVAVNGISTWLGGDSKNYLCYYLMCNKGNGDCGHEIPIVRWDIDVYCHTADMATAQAMGLSYTKHQGYVDGIELFDAKFFGISNNEALGMDPNQRKIMETSYEAMAMAGHDLKALQRQSQNIGVFVGTSGTEWGQVPHPSDSHGCGGSEAIMSNRVNFSCNLKGASQTLNTACSAGLVAMHTGKLHLLYKDYDALEASVAIGLNLAFSAGAMIGSCTSSMCSYQGRCFTFDKSADGYMRGEGCSCVYLNLESYSKDIFAIVAASQVNQDGRSASITAPNGPSQERCMKAALKEARMKPAEADSHECHGTGTALGDPIEVGAMKRVQQVDARAHPLMTTTSKSNFGHMEGGAGMGGFIKCVLQVMHCCSSPTVHFRETNPHLDNDAFPVYFMTENLMFPYDAGFTGVSSFGFGGTNGHGIAYSKNIMTAHLSNPDYTMKMKEKIAKAPAPEIGSELMENPEDWDSPGLPIFEENIGKSYQVEISTDSKQVVWREIVNQAAQAPTLETFAICGSWSEWGKEPMTESEDIPGLYAATVTIGSMGEELFHILAEENESMALYPAEDRCTRKCADILGPTTLTGSQEDCSWCIYGEPGSTMVVELFYSPSGMKSVTWYKARQSMADVSS